MRATTILKFTVLTAALGLGVFSARAQQQDTSQQQSGDAVADAARKARDEKKNAAKPKKVLTEDDLAGKSFSKATDTTSGQNASGGSGTQSGSGASGSSNTQKNGEADWRARFKVARDKVTNAEKQLDVMQREFEKSQIQYYPDPQKALMEQNSRQEINDRAAKIEAQKASIAKFKQELSDLEDELRKAGGDPGWARE